MYTTIIRNIVMVTRKNIGAIFEFWRYFTQRGSVKYCRKITQTFFSVIYKLPNTFLLIASAFWEFSAFKKYPIILYWYTNSIRKSFLELGHRKIGLPAIWLLHPCYLPSSRQKLSIASILFPSRIFSRARIKFGTLSDQKYWWFNHFRRFTNIRTICKIPKIIRRKKLFLSAIPLSPFSVRSIAKRNIFRRSEKISNLRF